MQWKILRAPIRRSHRVVAYGVKGFRGRPKRIWVKTIKWDTQVATLTIGMVIDRVE